MRSLLLLLALLSIVAARADDNLQSVLDNHLRSDVAYWLAEPRLFALLRDNNQRTAALSSDEVGALEARWQQEVLADDGELSEHMLSRFASKYLAEVSLRMDGAYGRVIALDNRGLVAAASDLTDHYWLGGDICVGMLAQRGDAPWAQDRQPATGGYTCVAMPVQDPATGERLGTLLLDVDVARLMRQPGIRSGSSRLARDTVTLRSTHIPAAEAN